MTNDRTSLARALYAAAHASTVEDLEPGDFESEEFLAVERTLAEHHVATPVDDALIEQAAREHRHAIHDDDFYGWSSQSDAHDDGFAAGAEWRGRNLTPVPQTANPLNRLADDLDHLRGFNAGEFGNIVTPEWQKHRDRANAMLASMQRPDPEFPSFSEFLGLTASATNVEMLRHLATSYPILDPTVAAPLADETSLAQAIRAAADDPDHPAIVAKAWIDDRIVSVQGTPESIVAAVLAQGHQAESTEEASRG